MKFGNNPYELPNNTDLESVLKKNLDHTNPIEMKEKVVNGETRLFPFWVPVKDSEGVTASDYKEYMSKRDKALDIKAKKDKVGIVQPKDPSKSYDGSDIIEKINNVISSHNDGKVFDNTGAVEVVKNSLDGTKTSTQVTDNSVGKPKEVVVEKSAESKTGVGAVTPQAEMGKQTSVDVSKPTTKGTKETKESKVGAVSAKSEMGTQTKVDVTKGSTNVKEGKVGAVKPKSDMPEQMNAEINFDKFKTSNIKTTPYK